MTIHETAKSVFSDPNHETEFKRLQQRILVWQEHNFGRSPVWQLALGCAEEAGELCHAVLKNAQGIRGYDQEDKYLDAVADAIGDQCVYMMSLCGVLGLDFSTIVRMTTEDVLKRDWKKNPVDAAAKAVADGLG